VRASRLAPVRTCVGCGERDEQNALMRFVLASGGRLQLDQGRRLHGRGAYLHRAEDCLARFSKRKGRLRSLRVAVDPAARAGLVAELRKGE
jgi:predicted RNA-binding protein YlxR (DUF448 family)